MNALRNWFRKTFNAPGKSTTRKTRLSLESLEGRMVPTGLFMVTNTLDTGAGSLRQAILMADASPTTVNTPNGPAFTGPNLIEFAIGSGAKSIAPSTPLPWITTDYTFILGNTQSGFAGKPLIQLSGQTAGAVGLEVMASNCVVQDLVVNGFLIQVGLENGHGNTVDACYLGTDSTGTKAVPNSNGSIGVDIFNSSGNLIGGTTASARNIISGDYWAASDFNGGYGVLIDQSSNSNTVEGNFIGTDVSGIHTLTNVVGGLVGTQQTAGVCILGGAYNQIGGPLAGQVNVISSNHDGVYIAGIGPRYNYVKGNHIGTDVTGTRPLGNSQDGVFIYDAVGNVIGGASSGDGNVISANGANGIRIYADAAGPAVGNKVQGNWIGTDKTGTLHLGNHQNGVYLQGDPTATTGSYGNEIGGADNGDPVPAGVGNTIAFNTLNGVLMQGNMMVSNPIRGNAIYGNGALGINTDEYPPQYVQLALASSVSHLVEGYVFNPTPYAETVVVDLYASTSTDAPGGGAQGRRYLGTVTLYAVPGANFFTFSGNFANGEMISATITEYSHSITSGFESPLVAS
jgi:titin